MRVGKEPIVLTAKDRKALEMWVDRPGVPLRLIIRAWIILLSASGHSTANISSRLGVSASTVLYWRTRFIQGGLASISEGKKISKPRHGDDEIRKIIEATEKQFPTNARRWSIRNMAKLTGVSRSTIQRIWKQHGLKPFDAEFKLRHDPNFYEKCKDVAGVYIESDHVYAAALLADGQPPPPSKSARAPSDSQLICRVLRAVNRGRKPVRLSKPDFLDFLKWVDSYTPPTAILHLILPRRSMTIHPHVFRWLKRRPRFQVDVIPKEIQARKFLEEWYTNTCRAAGRSTFSNLPDLAKSMEEYLESNGKDLTPAVIRLPVSKPFFWVRPDRNYQTDESQLELNLSLA